MKIHIVDPATGVLSDKEYSRVLHDVQSALSAITANSPDKFIINNSAWYSYIPNKKGKLELKRRVMNSADFMSKKFGFSLKALGWQAGDSEASIANQDIDGYIEIMSSSKMFGLPESKLFDFLAKYQKLTRKTTSVKTLFDEIYARYCRSSWVIPENMDNSLKTMFEERPNRPIRIGLEFETGNIASSFRALAKLNYLYTSNLIDYGVFVTSIDQKSTAWQIWPSSNRNGSFRELNARNAFSNLHVPLLKIGFEPDGLSKKAGFLGANGQTYKPKATGKKKKVKGVAYLEYKINGQTAFSAVE